MWYNKYNADGTINLYRITSNVNQSAIQHFRIMFCTMNSTLADILTDIITSEAQLSQETERCSD